MIEFKNVSKYYKTKTGVTEGIRNVSVHFSLNEFVAITGESGSGKTTLLNVLSGFDSYEDGEIYLNGEETSHFTVKEWENFRAKNIGFVFQSYNIIDAFTVYQNIIIALDAEGYDKKKRKARALELIKEVGLEKHLHHKAAKLSGGEKQRVVIARALAKDAKIILADEPTGNLDKESGQEIMKLLKKISKDKLILLVTHNYGEAEAYVTRNLILEDGGIKDDRVITILESEQEEALVLNEESTTNTFLNAFKLAFKNIIATPKRTIFTLSLSLLVIIAFLFFYVNLILSVRIEMGLYTPDNEIYLLKRSGDSFTKTDYLALKNDSRFESKYRHVFISPPNLEAIYFENESYEIYFNVLLSSTLLEKKALENKRDIYLSDVWSLRNFSAGDQITLIINEREETFTIKDKVMDDSANIYFHPDLLFDEKEFKLNKTYFEREEIDELHLIALDRAEIKLVKKILLENEKYRVIDPYLQEEEMTKLGLSIAVFFLWLVLIGILAVLFLVSYNILKNMMQARNKDFAVYRSVGVLEKEIAVMILFEQVFIALVAFLIAILGLNLLALINKSIYQVTRHLTLKDYLTISIVFLMFSIFQGLKFNRKIFNLTVIEALKEEL